MENMYCGNKTKKQYFLDDWRKRWIEEIEDGGDDDRWSMIDDDEFESERKKRGIVVDESREEHERVEEGGSPNAWSLGFPNTLSSLPFPIQLSQTPARVAYLLLTNALF